MVAEMAKRIALISDTHMQHDGIDIPACDILLHAGDYSSYGDLKDLTNFNKWLGTLKQCKNIVIVDGNHDLFAATSYPMAKTLFSNATYIRDELIEVQGLKIWGSPWSKTFGRWAYMTSEEELLLKYQRIPEGIDILISHTPVYGILDKVERVGSVGSTSLRSEVFDRIKPRLVVAGHLHLNGGLTKTENGIIFANAAICDEDYNPSREPIFLYL
jgi:Icc-related predicted phosphoesterase